VHRVFSFIIVFLYTFSGSLASRGDVFILNNGSRITGEITNRNENPRKQYIIKLADDCQITLAAAQVDQVLHIRPEETEYERIRPAYPDTVAAQWSLAEWCRQNKLNPQREMHLKRIIELDTDNNDARRALGYTSADGKWVTQDQLMIDRGYKRYKGRWLTQQEIDKIENENKQEAQQQEWAQTIKRWRSWLGTKRDQQA
jgi:hypothetical protein